MRLRPPRSPRTDTRFPDTTLFRSFQAPEDGVHQQEAMPDVPGPDDLKSETELRREMVDDIPEKFRRHMLRARPIEIRPVHPRSWFTPEKRPPAQDRKSTRLNSSH